MFGRRSRSAGAHAGPRSDEASRRRSFRRTVHRWILTAIYLVFPLIFFSGAAVAETGLVSRYIYGAIGVALLFLSARVFRMGIFIDDRGVLIRNIRRGTSISWDDIHHFARPTMEAKAPHAGLQVHRTDGTIVYSQLYSPGVFNSPDFADDVLRQLELAHRNGRRRARRRDQLG